MMNLINMTLYYSERLHGWDFVKWAFVRIPVDGWKWNPLCIINLLMAYAWAFITMRATDCPPIVSFSHFVHSKKTHVLSKTIILSHKMTPTDNKHGLALLQIHNFAEMTHSYKWYTSIVFIFPKKRLLSFLSETQPSPNNNRNNGTRQDRILTDTHTHTDGETYKWSDTSIKIPIHIHVYRF